MGTGAANSVGMTEAPVTFDDSVRCLTGLFDGATKEKSGSFLEAATGDVIPW